jgi:hypothetical protein
MWIILIDHSGSMGKPFTGNSIFAGRSTKSKANSKLEDAVDAILERLPGRSLDEQVVIIAFTSKAKIIAKGRASDYNLFESALNQLVATNGTDIAAGLEKANEFLSEHPSSAFPTLLLVTDGQSDADRALRAKEKLINKIVQLSAIIIDPTDKAEELLRNLLHNGEIQGVTSDSKLKKEIGTIDKNQKEFAQQISEIYEKLVDDENSALTIRDQSEDISFLVAYPKLLIPEIWTALLFYIHASSLSEQISNLLRERASELFLNPAFAQTETSTTIPRGTELTIIPNLLGIKTNPREIRIIWEEQVHDLVLRIKANSQLVDKRIIGSIDVYVEGALIGDVPISLTISDGKQQSYVEKPHISNGNLYRRVFVSYSRKDIDVVKACIKTYEALGIYVYWDKQELRNRSGEAWKEALKKFISDSNVFQLYWSHSSSNSKWVEMEYLHALTNTGNKGQRFIRPLVWEEDFPALPAALADLQLGFLDLEIWRPALANKDETQLTHTFSILEPTVIPNLPGIPQATVNIVREDISYAIQFLEKTTELRYYPVPTLLVDDFIVQSVRKELVIDTPPLEEGNSAPEQAIHLSKIVQAIAVAFHVRFRGDFSENYDEFDKDFGKGNLFSASFFDKIKMYCEFVISRLVMEYPAVAEMRLRKLLGESKDLDIPLYILVRQLVLVIVDDIINGKYNPMGYRIFSFSEIEYESVKHDLNNVGIPVSKNEFMDKISYDLDINSSKPFTKLAGSFINDIEKAIQDFAITFEDYSYKDLRTRILGRLISSGLKLQNFEIEEALTSLVSSAFDPKWKEVLSELVTLNDQLFSTNMNSLEMIQEFLGVVSKILREGVKKYGSRFIKIGYTVPKKSWIISEKLLNINGITIDDNKNSWSKEGDVFISGSLANITDLFDEVSEQLIRALGKPMPAKVDRFFVVQAPTFGIFTQQGNPSIDKKMRHWALDVGIPPDFTLPGVSRVLLCLNTLDRFRETLKQRNKPMFDASKMQRSVMIHEHFHAIVAGGLNPDGHLPQGSRIPKSWNKASPVNESLAAWMQLHDSRDKPEIWEHILAYISMGRYPEWPYAGAIVLEKIYQEKGLSEIQKWIHNLRNDPETCILAFNDLIDNDLGNSISNK